MDAEPSCIQQQELQIVPFFFSPSLLTLQVEQLTSGAGLQDLAEYVAFWGEHSLNKGK